MRLGESLRAKSSRPPMVPLPRDANSTCEGRFRPAELFSEIAMLNQTADYALRALIYLAHSPEDGYHQTRDLAAALNVPANYLGKILQQLGHRQIVESQRGMNGGFRLARLPDQVRLFDVLAALDLLPHD